MTHPESLLSSPGRAALSAFASSPTVLLAFDYDGVLAPIAPTPAEAHMRAPTRRLLIQVARRYACIVVSGRQLSDLEPRLRGVPLRMAFGNFGYEPAPATRRPSPHVARWVSRLEDRLAHRAGIVIEDKQFSVAVHYRQASHRERARQVILDAVTDLPGARVLNGSNAIVLVPDRGPDKGVTLQGARRRMGCRTAIYLGDDDTDEPAFGSAPPSRLLAIRVGREAAVNSPARHGDTRARFRLAEQLDVDMVLRCLLDIHKEPHAERHRVERHRAERKRRSISR